MPVFPDGDAATDEIPYVSTGHLPASELVATSVAEAHARYKSNTDGSNSEVYPAPGSGTERIVRCVRGWN